MSGKDVSAGVVVVVVVAIAFAGPAGAGAADCKPSLGNIPSSQCPNRPKQKLKDASPKTKATLKNEGAEAKDKVKQAGPKTVKSLQCASGPTSDGKCP